MKKDTARKAKKPKEKIAEVAMVAIDYERVKTISGVVRLKDVLLTHSHWHSATRAPRLEVEPTTMAFNFALADATWEFVPELKLLEIRLEYRLAAFAKVAEKNDGQEVPLFQLECDWDAIFAVPDDFTPSNAEALADFAVANGQLNAFPYVRQFVQDVTGRAGWPPLVLPTFRIPVKRPKPVGGPRKPSSEGHEHA